MSRPATLTISLLMLGGALAQDTAHADLRTQFLRRNAHILLLDAGLDQNANSIRNELVFGLWRGIFLDRELRERSGDDLRERNSAGYVLHARLEYIAPGEGPWRQVMSVAHHEQVGLRFPRDLYNVTFFGNAMYEGQRADLGPARSTRIQYQTIGFGVQHSRERHYARVDLVMGQTYDEVDVDWAGLYTGVDGRVLRASVLGDHWRSDTSLYSIGSLNGLGLAASGRWATRLSRSSDAQLELEVQDLGFVGWGNKSLHLHKDSVLEYSGIRVAHILDLDDAILGEDQLIDTLGFNYEQGAFTKPLPFYIGATASASLGGDWCGSLSVDQRYLPGYVPQVCFAAERPFGADTEARMQISMGGFGGLRLGAAAQHRFGDHFLLMLSTPHLPGLFWGGTRGAGLAFSASVGF